MKKLKKDWQGLVPQYFPDLEGYIEKEFDPEKLQKKYPQLITMKINDKEQSDLVIKVVFSLARQIPSDWKKTKVLIPDDKFIIFYIREFVWDCFLEYREMHYGLEDSTYDGEFSNILDILGKLYQSKQNMSDVLLKFSKYAENNKFKKIYENARNCAGEDSNKIVSKNPKKSKLKWEDVLYGGKKTNKLCNLLRDYISKKY